MSLGWGWASFSRNRFSHLSRPTNVWRRNQTLTSFLVDIWVSGWGLCPRQGDWREVFQIVGHCSATTLAFLPIFPCPLTVERGPGEKFIFPLIPAHFCEIRRILDCAPKDGHRHSHFRGDDSGVLVELVGLGRGGTRPGRTPPRTRYDREWEPGLERGKCQQCGVGKRSGYETDLTEGGGIHVATLPVSPTCQHD